MGRKVHPYGFRLGVSRTWTAKWYADKEYTSLLKEDIGIRKPRVQRQALVAGQRQRSGKFVVLERRMPVPENST